jgi:hypothetical protein
MGCLNVPTDGEPDTVVTTTTTTTTTTTQPPVVDTSWPASVRNNMREDIGPWKQTVTIGNVRWDGNRILFDYLDGAGRQRSWGPKRGRKNVNSCLVVLIEKDGKLHQCAVDWLWGGLDWQTKTPFIGHGNLINPPLRGWKAKRGERLGICVCAHNWSYGPGNVRERSNVAWITYE